MPNDSSNDETNEYVCCQCNKPYPLTQFFNTYSGLYAATGHLPVCRKCLMELFDRYTEAYGSPRKAMQRICMAYDLYYNDALYDKCDGATDAMLGNYIKKLNMIQYKGRTFDTTLNEGFVFSEFGKKKVEKEEPKINPKDTEKWGDGLSAADYGVLNSHYNLLMKANPNCDSNQEIFIIDLCYSKMLQIKAIREGRTDEFSKASEQYRKSFREAKLKIIGDASANEDFTLGVNIEAIEKYTPAEYYKNKELYRDNDKIGEYIERFLLRPLRNLMHGTTDRDYEFYVHDEEDADEYSEDE